MLKDNKDIDGLFADGLKNLSVPPSSKVWDGVSGKMLNVKKKRRLRFYIWTGVAASLFLLLAVGNQYFIGDPNQHEQTRIVSDHLIFHEKKSNENRAVEEFESFRKLRTEKENSNRRNSNEEKKLTTSKTNGLFADSRVLYSEDSKETFQSVKNTKIKENFINSKAKFVKVFANLNKEDDHFLFLDKTFVKGLAKSGELSNITNSDFHLPTRLNTNNSRYQQNQSLASLAEQMQIERNIMALEHLKQKDNVENRWSVIGQVSSSFSSYSGDKKGNNAEKGIWSVGGGAKLNYAMNDKLAFQTGIVYNRFGQDVTTGGERTVFSSNSKFTLNSNTNERPTVYPAQTSAGAIKLSNNEVRSRTVSDYLGDVSSESLIQSFKSVEIPLLMRYNLISKRIGMFVTGGLSANMIVDNGVYDQSQGNKKIGEIDGIRTANFSSQFSFGLEYRLNSRLQIGVEPSMKYYLNSINKSNEYQYKPYSIGVFTGIRYDF